jgi:aryl-alcohol dehydrogenase-like predicted oxidoreductase
MEHRILGRSGLEVSTFCLGTMVLGAWGNPDHDECEAIVRTALDAGINFVDTADMYAFGESEEIVGRALRGRRDDVILATKAYNPMGEDPNQRGSSRRWLIRAVEDSLRRLQTDWIDLFQLHRPDRFTDIDATLGALSDLVHAGKIRAFGTSTFPAELLVEAQWTAERGRHERPATEQPPYSILARGIEAAVLPTCQRYGLGVLVWAPLNGGWLTGKYREGAAPASSRADREPDHFDFGGDAHQRKMAVVEELAALADDSGLRLVDLAHGFVLAHPGVTSAIIGPRTLEQLQDVLAGAGTRLPPDVLDRVDQLVPPGVDVNPDDAGYQALELAEAALRRRASVSGARRAGPPGRRRPPASSRPGRPAPRTPPGGRCSPCCR